MSLANVHQKLVDQAADQLALGVDAGNELRNDLEPSVDVDGPDTFHQGFVHFRPVTVVEPEGEEAEGVLEGTAVGKSDGAEEALDGRDGVGGHVLGRLSNKENRFHG